MYTRTSRKKAREARERRALWRAVGSTLIGAACGLWTLAPSALAAPADTGDLTLPDGGKVVSGTVAIDTSAKDSGVLNINQGSDKAIINWDSFSIGTGATVNFNHYKGTLGDGAVQNTAGITLNRVVGSNMSEIYGKINSVGSVILVNQNGILFGAGSEVNAAGIVASTADVDTDKFLDKDELKFVQTNTTNNNITVLGSMTASINGDYLATGSAYHQTLSASALNLGNRQKVTGFSAAGNKIMLVADGDVAVGKDAKLVANTETTVTGGGTVGSESFSVGGDSSTRESSVVIRADQNADDVAIWDEAVAKVASDGSYTYNKTEKFTYSSKGHTDGVVEGDNGTYLKTAKVYLANTNKIESQNVGVYWDSDVTSAGISNQGKEGTGTDLSSIGLSGTASKTFTQKDYTTYATEASKLKDHVTTTGTITVNTYEVTDATNNTVTKGTSANSGVETTFATLVNNVYQLQAISKIIDNGSTVNNTYGNIDSGTTYALGTTISAAETEKWQGGKGFDPIGNDYNNFFGNFTGNGGSNTYGIYDLNINRPTEYYVGLFSGTSGSNIWSVSIIDSLIKGKGTVGGIAGKAENTWFDNVTMRKRVKDYDGETTKTANTTNVYGAENNVGGIVGAMTNSTIRYGINGGQVENGVDGVGGLAGTAAGMLSGQTYTIGHYSQNKGYYSATEDVDKGYGVVKGATNTTDQSQGGSAGGLVGIAGATDKTTVITGKSYSNGQVSGRSNVGGIVGQTIGANTTISQVYNTNEASTLTTVIIDADKMVVGSSKYGKVSSVRDTVGCVGGIVGFMNDGTVSESYNAGNVSGPSAVGGVVGNMQGGTIVNSYSADNNTVLKTSTDDASYYGFTYGSDKYTYDQDKQCWYKNGDTTIALSTAKVLEDAPESGRLYNNRLAYRDATVTATGENGTAGGVVGNFAGGTLKNTYAAGKVSSTGTNGVKGGIIGRYDTTSSATKTAESLNFYVTTQNVTGKDVSGLGTGKAVGDGTFSGTGADTLKDVTLWQAQNVSGTTSDSVEGAVSWITNDLNATNQDNTWMVYSNSATPTLKCFMNWININRQYVYDGTVHNLKTTDVSNYYGGAFFTNGKGQNVYTSGVDKLTDASNAPSEFVYAKNTEGTMASDSDDTSYSSFYQYENSNMWSPQHGYYTDPTAGLIITPKTITATLSGTKVYGQTLKGYYYSDGTSNYIYDATSSKWKVADEDTDLSTLYKLTVKSTNVSGTPLISLIDDDGNAIIEGLTELSLNGQKGYTSTAYSSDSLDDQKLNAGTYTTTTATKLTVDDATSSPLKMQSTVDKDGKEVTAYDTHNYVAKYDANLTVKKADLVITATGSREYGVANGTTGYTFTHVAQADTTDASKANDGKLKSWDTNPDITKATGVTNYTLYSTDPTKNTDDGIDYTDKNGSIAKSTWVATTTDDSGKLVQDSYTLGTGSFQHTVENKDGSTSTVNELTSDNYNIIYIGNASDEQVKTVTGVEDLAGYLCTVEAAEKNAYTINPVELKYNVTGGHFYGDASIAQEYDVEAADETQLRNGEQIYLIVTKQNLDALGVKAAAKAGLTNASHVKRDKTTGKYVAYTYENLSEKLGSEWTNDVALANDSLNYNLKVNNLEYTITPATLTYTAGNYHKTYGETAFTANADNDALTGKDTLTGFVTINGVTETIDTVFDATKGDTATKTDADATAKKNVTKVTRYTFISEDEDGNKTDLTAANANVMRDENGNVAYYDGAVGTSEDAWLNDYYIKYEEGSAIINPKQITYTVADKTKTYGNTALDNGATFTGDFANADGTAGTAIVTGDTVGTIEQTSYSASDDTTQTGVNGMDKTANVTNYNGKGNTYSITVDKDALQDAVGGNYEVTGVADGTLTINKREVSYDIADKTKVYGTGLTNTSKDFGIIFKDDDAFTVEEISDIVDLSGVTFTVKDGNDVDGTAKTASVGKYNITVATDLVDSAIEGNGNFTLIGKGNAHDPGTLTVTKRQVAFNVDDNYKTYGDKQAAKEFSGTFGTLTNADGSLNTDSGIIAEDLKLVDYSKLTGNYTVTGSVDTNATADAGTYEDAIGITEANAQKALTDNYEVTLVNNGDFTINKKAVTINIDNKSKTYGSTALTDGESFSYTVDGEVAGGTTVSLKQTDFTSSALTNEKANAGSYSDITLVAGTDLGNNYTVGTINNGTLTVNKKNVTYTIDSASREFVSANPTFSGSFTGVESWDSTDTLAQDGYTLRTTDIGSKAGTYTGEITTTADKASALLGTAATNYSVTVVDGDLTITPVTVYYKADPVSAYRGEAKINEPTTYTGRIVKADGTDITEYMTDSDKAALNFIPVDENDVQVTNTAGRGTYNIMGQGVKGSESYIIDTDVPQWYQTPSHLVPGESYGLTITGMAPDEQRQYEGIKDSMEPGAQNGESTFISLSHGGYIPEEARNQLRLLTIEDSGINVASAIGAIDAITIAPSSYANVNGGGNLALAASATLAGYRNGSIAGGAANGASVGRSGALGEFRPGDIANNSNDDEDELKKQAKG